MQGYKTLQEKHKGLINYDTGENLDGYYLLPYTDIDGNISYYTGEAIHRGEAWKKDETLPKYRKITGLEAPLFNERYLYMDEQVVFIVERHI